MLMPSLRPCADGVKTASQPTAPSERTEVDREKRKDSNGPTATRSSENGAAGRGRSGGGGGMRGSDLLEEELHVYIAAMQLFPIKLNFSFIKNADVKVPVWRAKVIRVVKGKLGLANWLFCVSLCLALVSGDFPPSSSLCSSLLPISLTR